MDEDHEVTGLLKQAASGNRETMDQVVSIVYDERTEELLSLDLSLQELETMDARQAQVVECRFFGGLNVDETAEAPDISPATVKRDWTLAPAWLNRQLRPEATDE